MAATVKGKRPAKVTATSAEKNAAIVAAAQEEVIRNLARADRIRRAGGRRSNRELADLARAVESGARTVSLLSPTARDVEAGKEPQEINVTVCSHALPAEMEHEMGRHEAEPVVGGHCVLCNATAHARGDHAVTKWTQFCLACCWERAEAAVTGIQARLTAPPTPSTEWSRARARTGNPS